MSQTNTTLTELRWQHRILLIQANQTAIETIMDQLRAAGDKLEERDLLVFLLPDPVSYNGAVRLADGGALARLFDLSGDTLRAVLFGKDGGVKLRQAEELDLGKILLIIDAMPMRQREMREQR